MIVVSCNSFKQAQDAFSLFMDFLEKYEPLSINKVFEYSYSVETDDDLRYIFIDYRFENLFKSIDRPDIVDVEEFFEGIDEYYFDGQLTYSLWRLGYEDD